MGEFKTFVEQEERRTSGCYVSCDYDHSTGEKLLDWCVKSLIPKPLHPDKYHSTILYSRAPVPKADEIIKGQGPWELPVVGFKLFDSVEDISARSLVILLKAPQLEKLHKDLLAAGGTHDYDEFIPHLTVTYFAPRTFDLQALSVPDFKLKIKSLKVEPLNLNWKDQ